MIDVMHVISGLGTGGAETMLVQLAAALRRRGLSQHVISLAAQDALVGELRSADVGTTILGGNALMRLPASLASLVSTVNRFRPRRLQGWMYHGNLAATVAHHLCAGRSKRSLLWNLRASNMDDARYGGTIRLAGLLSRLPEIVVTNSQAGVDFHRSRGFRCRRFMVIDNGIDTAKFRPDSPARTRIRAELGIPDRATLVIHVARVDPMKDHATFMAAMAKLPSLAGLMVGQGTTDLPTPANVHALGLRRDAAALYAAADIVASTSAFGEGFSNVIAEGMSAGLIPAATDVGGARHIIGDTGAVVAPRDADGFAAALAALAALSAAERERRSAAARERIVANFTLAQATDAFARLYAEA